MAFNKFDKSYPSCKASGSEQIGVIPSEWNYLPLKRIVSTKITDGPHETPDFIPDGIPFISAEAIKNNKIDFSLKRGDISPELHKQYCKKTKPQSNDIFFIKSGATTGNIAIVETDIEFSIWSPLAVIRCDPLQMYHKYLFYFMQSNEFKKQVEIYWSFGTQQNIGMGVISRLCTPVPSVDEQQAIASFLDRETTRINRIIEKQTRLIELLKEKRSALITQAVTKGLDPNAKMKDSGVEWIGEIPEGWGVIRLRFTIIFNPKKSGITGIENNSEVQFVPMELVPDNDENLSLEQTAVYQDVRDGYTYFQDGDILIAKITPCFENGKGAIANNLTNCIGFGTTELHVLRPKQDMIQTKYLFYLTKLQSFREIGESMMKGAAGQKRVPELFIKDCYLPIPPLLEQKGIVDYIDESNNYTNSLISKIEKQIDLLNEYKQSLITAAVTGKIDVRNVQ
ncbi:MAG: restriction endonuclease subunit S [Spirochaetes bacterium]|nr:restriction endonuclease subunit S [Spirochaetota bacterium]